MTDFLQELDGMIESTEEFIGDDGLRVDDERIHDLSALLRVREFWETTFKEQEEMDSTPRWYDKYKIIHRATGEEVTEAKFTLLPERDPAAREALETYAKEIEAANPGLASDIRRTLAEMPQLQM